MNPSDLPMVLGVDVGTSGVRSLASTADGEVVAEAHAALSDLPAAGSALTLMTPPAAAGIAYIVPITASFPPPPGTPTCYTARLGG
jgi:hypothetical protein